MYIQKNVGCSTRYKFRMSFGVLSTHIIFSRSLFFLIPINKQSLIFLVFCSPFLMYLKQISLVWKKILSRTKEYNNGQLDSLPKFNPKLESKMKNKNLMSVCWCVIVGSDWMIHWLSFLDVCLNQQELTRQCRTGSYKHRNYRPFSFWPTMFQ